MHANQSKQMTRTFDMARGTAMQVPEAIAGEITASFDAIDATKAASNFSNICREVGCGDLYWVYGDPEPVSPPVSVHEQRLHRAGVRCPPAHAAPRLPGERPAHRPLPDLVTAGPGPASA